MTHVILCLFALTTFVFADEPCDIKTSVDISDGPKQQDDSIIFNGITYKKTQYYADGNVTRGCICAVKGQCLRKCCRPGQVNDNGCKNATDSSFRTLNETVFDGKIPTNIVAENHFGILPSIPCKGSARKYSVSAKSLDEKVRKFYLQKDGSLQTENNKYALDDYCIVFKRHGSKELWTSRSRTVVLLCQERTQDQPIDHLWWYSVGKLISVPFMVLTILVYLLVPSLRNLHGMVLISHLTSLISFSTFQASLQLFYEPTWTHNKCLVFFFITYYSCMASFLWLNVMCFDIWRTFSGSCGLRDSKLHGKWRCFTWYSCYAWGVPIILTGFLAFMQLYSQISHEIFITPRVGEQNKGCWFHDKTSEGMYMHLPVSILLFVNTFFFAATAYKILQMKRDMLKSQDSSRHRRFEKDRYRLCMYVKLSLVMGINWFSELLSIAVGGDPMYWYFTDAINILVGVAIFILFVCKKEIFYLVMIRLKLRKFVPESATITTSSRSLSVLRSNRNTHQSCKVDMKKISTQPTVPPAPMNI